MPRAMLADADDDAAMPPRCHYYAMFSLLMLPLLRRCRARLALRYYYDDVIHVHC